MPILEACDVHYAYETHRVLRGVSLALEQGKLYAILGPSGCGKTTLLSLLGGLDSPTQGQILFDGEDIAQHGLARHRRDHVSFVFQAYNLIDYLTPAENVALSGTPHPHPRGEQQGLKPEGGRRRVAPRSRGPPQRGATARALASQAPVILADEPTGNLDADTAREIAGILQDSAHGENRCVVVVTHDHALAKRADVILRLKRGVVSL